MSLGTFKGRHQDVLFHIKADEQLSPNPPDVWIRKQGSSDWGSPLSPVIEDTNTDGLLYNEFKYLWDTKSRTPDRELGVYEIKTGDTDLTGNWGEVSGTFDLHGSYQHHYGYDYGWGM
jgi:hypothetical protein